MIGGHGDGLDFLRWMTVQAKLEELESKLSGGREGDPGLRAVAAEKARQGATLTREETAAFLNVSTKKLQRMEARRQIRRCPALDGVVRYAARDVLKLASALGKEA